MKKRGETLVESLLSMFFIVVILVPVSNIFLKSYKIDKKLNSINIDNEIKNNMIELIKTKNNVEIMRLIGEYEVNNIGDFYNKFFIENRYRIIKNDLYKKVKITIKEMKNPTVENIKKIEIKIDEIKGKYEFENNWK